MRRVPSTRARSATQADNRGAGTPALGRRIGEAGDERMAGEDRLHDLPLDADAAAMDQPHLDEPSGVSGVEILGDDRGDVTRREGVQVERILDGDADGLVVPCYSRGPPSTCSFQ